MAKKKYSTILDKPQATEKIKSEMSYIQTLQPYQPKKVVPQPIKILKSEPKGYLSTLGDIINENLSRAKQEGIILTPEKARATEKEAFAKQKEQQSRLAQTPFGAFSAGVTKGIMPIPLEKQYQQAFTPSAQKHLSDSKAEKAGEFAGTAASFAMPYEALGGTVLKGTSKVAPKLIPALSKVAETGITKAIPKITQEAAKKYGTRAAESLVKDIVIGLPQNIAYATGKEGLTGEGAAKDIAVNTALDILLGGVLETAPLLLKSGKRVKNEVDFSALPAEEKAEAVQEIVKKYTPKTKTLAKKDTAQAEGLFVDYYPEKRAKDVVKSDEYHSVVEEEGFDPEEYITVYRGAPKTQATINNGDWVTTSKQLAEDYSGGGKIIQDKIQAKYLYAPKGEGIDELIYSTSKTDLTQGTIFKKQPELPVQTILPKAGQTVSPEVVIPIKSEKTTVFDKIAKEEPTIAKVTTKTDEIKPSVIETLSGITSSAKRKFVDSGDTVAKISKINNDKTLYQLFDNAKKASKRAEYMVNDAQTDILGNEIGKSMKDIFKPIIDKGDDYYRKFQEYKFHLHNIDRMEQGKPVFGETVSAEESANTAAQLLNENPEFAQLGKEVDDYLKNLMQYRIDSGLVGQETADLLSDVYKNYVPTYRAEKKSIVPGLSARGGTAQIAQTVKTAKGSSRDLLPLHEQIAKQTMQTVEAANKNIFGLRLAENANEKTAKYIQDLKKTDEKLDIDALAEEAPELKGKFNIYKDGVGYQLKVDDTLFEGIKSLTNTPAGELQKAAVAANKAFKELITSWSPIFAVKNVARDIQDVGFYTKDLGQFAKAYPSAVKEIATNGAMWKKYKALGGAGSSFFDYAKGFKEPFFLRRNTVDKMESLNMSLEQLPRFAEFMATINKLGHAPSYDELMEAMYNAADVTVNFGRSGTWGKVLNSTFVPFFNPAIQGTSKLIRRFTETKGVKDWTSLVLKAAALGVAPSLINEMIYSNDKDYQIIDNTTKDTNFLFKVGDNFVKIPKGRVLSMFGATSQRAYRANQGAKEPFAGFVQTAKQQIAPISPMESNILSPLYLASQGKTWYGGDIEPMRLKQFKPSERYDEATTKLSIEVAKRLGKYADKMELSPKKLDYILDSYSGILGDVIMPMMTKRAEKTPIQKAFVVDPVLQNKISQDFYKAKDEITFEKNSQEQGKLSEYHVMNRYMNKVTNVLNEKYAEIRTIESSDIPDADKKRKVRVIRQEINDTQLKALDNLKNIDEKSKDVLFRYGNLTDSDKDLNFLYEQSTK